MARETGLEPAASAVTGRRSNQLSYSRNSAYRRPGQPETQKRSVEIRVHGPEVKRGKKRRRTGDNQPQRAPRKRPTEPPKGVPPGGGRP